MDTRGDEGHHVSVGDTTGDGQGIMGDLLGRRGRWLRHHGSWAKDHGRCKRQHGEMVGTSRELGEHHGRWS